MHPYPPPPIINNEDEAFERPRNDNVESLEIGVDDRAVYVKEIFSAEETITDEMEDITCDCFDYKGKQLMEESLSNYELKVW